MYLLNYRLPIFASVFNNEKKRFISGYFHLIIHLLIAHGYRFFPVDGFNQY
jgi:hypothetical protein